MPAKVGQGMKPRGDDDNPQQPQEISDFRKNQGTSKEVLNPSIIEPVLRMAEREQSDGDLETGKSIFPEGQTVFEGSLKDLENMMKNQPGRVMLKPDSGPVIQPNGDLSVLVSISEEYVEPVRQWADAEGKTVEEWLTQQLGSYLESWGSPAQTR